MVEAPPAEETAVATQLSNLPPMTAGGLATAEATVEGLEIRQMLRPRTPHLATVEAIKAAAIKVVVGATTKVMVTVVQVTTPET